MVKDCDSSYALIEWDKVIEVENSIHTDVQEIESSKKKLKKSKKELLESYKAILLFGRTDEDNKMNAFSQTQNKKYLRKQIDYSYSQLANLKADVESEFLKDDKIKEYISTERKAISDLVTFTKQKSQHYQQGLSQYELLKPQIDEMLAK
jgi:hypothetical protein